MEDWVRNRILAEGILLGVGLFSAGAIVSWVRRLRRLSRPARGWWIAPVVLAVALPLGRRWLLDLDWFEAPAEGLREQVRRLPELAENLGEANEVLFDLFLGLGVPGAFLLGYLVKGLADAGSRLILRLPLFAAGILGLAFVYQFTAGEAESVSEAWENLRETASGLRK